jgi:hypothetical protein
MVGIENLKKLNAGLELLLTQIVETYADKKVDASDIGHLVELLKGFPVLIEMVKAIKEVPAEAKDVDAAELIVLANDYFQMISRIVKAYKDAQPVVAVV